jgi:surface protein
MIPDYIKGAVNLVKVSSQPIPTGTFDFIVAGGPDVYNIFSVEGAENFEVDWGEGGGWESIPNGTSLPSHSYTSVPPEEFDLFVVKVRGKCIKFSFSEFDPYTMGNDPFLDLCTPYLVWDILTPMSDGLYGITKPTKFYWLCYFRAFIFNPEQTAVPITCPEFFDGVSSGITDMGSLFARCNFFAIENFSVSGWDVSNVANMSSMFVNAVIYGPEVSSVYNGVADWDTSNVLDMSYIFWQCFDFNEDLSNWNTSNVINMSVMFGDCKEFNADISKWDTLNVENMNGMFAGCTSFNCDLSGWDTHSVVDMGGVFAYCNIFNQDISGWNTSNVTDMSAMFNEASSFNQDISGWSTANVTDMSSMFYAASSFNQDISGWNIGNLMSAETMFDDTSLSTTNYDALLIGWGAQIVQSGVSFGVGTVKYTSGGSAEAGRSNLVNTYSWSITDGGPV